jgi:hydroxyacylglutathione hydrolase
MEVVPGLHWVERIWDTKVYLLIEDDRIVIVDAATPGRAGAIWRYLASLGYPPRAADEIWLTHADIDHMGSVAALQAGSGARILAHRADAPLVEGSADRELGPVPLAGAYQQIFNWVVHRIFRPATVDRALADGEALGAWHVVHVPGHTPGSVCFYHPGRGIVLVGDALNHRSDRLGAPPPMFTPDMEQAYASIRKIAALEFDVCCFGHGPPLLENAQQQVRAFADSLSWPP